MATAQGSVTLGGAGGSVTAITGNDYVSAHQSMFQSMFQSMTAQFAQPGVAVLNGTDNLLFVPNGVNLAGVFDADTGSDAVVVGDSARMIFVGGSANSLILGGNGDNQVYAGNGNDTIALGTGTNQIYLGAGTSQVFSQGSHDLISFIAGGGGSITLSGQDAVVNGAFGGGSAALTIDDSQGTSSTINVDGGTTILTSSKTATTINAFGNTTVDGAAGTSGIYNQQGGTVKFIGTGGSINITSGGDGRDTLYGADGSQITLTNSSHDNVFVANDPRYSAGGAAYFDGSQASGGNEFWAGSGNATLIGGTGADTLVAGAGNSTMTGGSGAANNFVLFGQTSSASQVTIEDFGSAAGNTLDLFNFGASAAAQVLTSATTTSGNTTLSLHGVQVTLIGVDKSSLNNVNVVST